MPPIDFTRRTALYRFFDQEGGLLYVGVAFDPEARWKDHAAFKPWWNLVARKDVEWRDTRTEALIAEAEAIRRERPLHNIKGSDLPRGGGGQPTGAPSAPRPKRPMKEQRVPLSDRDWEDFGALCRAKGISRQTYVRLYVKRQIDAAFQKKKRAEAASES